MTEDLFFSIPKTNQFKDQNNTVVYLIEPGTVTESFANGTVKGFQSDEVRLNISGGPNQTTEIHVTLNSDQDPGRHDQRIGLLETGQLQDITLLLFGSSLGTNHTAQVLVASDVEGVNAVPEPATMLLLGSGMVGVVPFIRRKCKR